MPRYYEDSENTLPQKLRLAEGDQLDLSNSSFIVRKLIGNGGFGSVFKLESLAGGEFYAFKILYLDMVSPKDFEMLKSRLFLEYKIGSLKSEFLIRSLGVGMLSGNPFLLMEYAPYGTLFDHLLKISDDQQVLKVLLNVGEGLRLLHSKSFVHRDIKPENVLLGADGIYKLSDFGIAANLDQRLTRKDWWGQVLNNEAFGSPLYSPPEQLSKASYFKGTRHSMDIYSFGMLILWLVSGGKDPFGGEESYLKSPKDFIRSKTNFRFLDPVLISPRFNPGWKSVIEKCLQPDPEDRYKSIGELIQEAGALIGIQECIKGEVLELVDETGNIIRTFNLSDWGLCAKGKIRIGRNNSLFSENEVNLALEGSDVSQISKRHLTLIKTKEGWQVRDGQEVELNSIKFWKNSLNGTIVNGRKLERDEVCTLADGDYLMVGSLKILFAKK